MVVDAPMPKYYPPGFDHEKVMLPTWKGELPDNLYSHFGIDKHGAESIQVQFWMLGDDSYAGTFSWMKDGKIQEGRLETYGDYKVHDEKTKNDYPDITRLTSVLAQLGLNLDLSPLHTEEEMLHRPDDTLR